MMFCKWRTSYKQSSGSTLWWYLFRIILYGNNIITRNNTYLHLSYWKLKTAQHPQWMKSLKPKMCIFGRYLALPVLVLVSRLAPCAVSGVQTIEISAPSLQLREAADTRSLDKPTLELQTIHRFSQSRRRPLLGTSPGWKTLSNQMINER